MAQSGQRSSRRRAVPSKDGRSAQPSTVQRAPQTAGRKPSLKDALAATQQQTVPLLPARDPEAPDAPRRPTASYARATLAPRVPTRSPLPAAPLAGPTASGVRRAPRAKKTPQPDDADTGRILLARPEIAGAGEPISASAPATASHLPTLPPAPAEIADELTALVAAYTPDTSPGAGARLPALYGEDPRGVAATGAHDATDAHALLIRGARHAPAPRAGCIVPRRTGPRSFVGQFLIAMSMAMTLFGTLALASPLGQSGFFGSAFSAYANAVPWIPTPTATHRPTATPVPLVSGYNPPFGPNPGVQAIQNDIKAVFGQYSAGALNVSRCESGYDPNARNPYPVGNSHAMGVFQILFPSTWSGTSYARYSPYYYDQNIHAAYEIFRRDGYSWREWACQP
jgi:hypothetical protein